MGANDSSAVHSGGGPSGDTKGAGQLMAMLDHGVSAADLETTLSAWLEAGAIDQSTAAAARRLNAQLWEASRREGLLRVLYDTATDLTGIRDVEAVLKAIVRRTRSLIGSDIAYLSLNDYDSGESYVRVTDGATTALFRNIRMPLGEGVLGAVATGEAPAQSADYLGGRVQIASGVQRHCCGSRGRPGDHGCPPSRRRESHRRAPGRRQACAPVQQ